MYLTGDEMFLEYMLDGSSELASNSNYSWNIYHAVRKEQKADVALSGLRTDLEVEVDREYPYSILPSIPLENVIPCLLHALARFVEKPLSLVISDVLSTANIKTAAGGDGSAYRAEKIAGTI